MKWFRRLFTWTVEPGMKARVRHKTVVTMRIWRAATQTWERKTWRLS